MPSETRPIEWSGPLSSFCVFSPAGSTGRGTVAAMIKSQPARRVLTTVDFALTGLAVKVEPAHQDVPRHTATLITTRLAGVDGSSAESSSTQPQLPGSRRTDRPFPAFAQVLETGIGEPLLIPALASPRRPPCHQPACRRHRTSPVPRPSRKSFPTPAVSRLSINCSSPKCESAN